MKILIDARESGTSTGRYVDKLVENLAKLVTNHQFIILTKPHRADFMKSIAPDFAVVTSNVKEFTFAEQIKLWGQIKKQSPDLVHFSMTQQPVFYRRPKVTTIHDLTTLRFRNPAKNSLIFWVKQKVYAYVVRSVAKNSRQIITISQFVKDDIVRFSHTDPNKITVTYEAADKISQPPTALAELKNKKFLLYVGRPTPHKNLERLIKAMDKVRQNHPDILLVLAGKNDANYKRLAKLVEQKYLTSQVFFTDFVSEGQLRWLYEHAQAYVFPSLSEGFGLPPLEAMAHGLPVISSNATCLPEINKDAALYFDPESIDDIAAKILQFLDDPSLAKDLRDKGAAVVSGYSWARMAKQTSQVYERALK